MSDRALSNAYLRLRALIPGAYDTPHAPTHEQVWATTEAALRRLLQERDDAEAIHHEIIAAERVEYALEVWRDSLLLKTWSDADRMKSVLGHVSSSAIEAVLARRQSAGARPDVEIRHRHPLTGDTWVLDGRTGRTKEVVTEERAREEGARILAEATDDFVAAQRLAPYPRVPDAYTHERIAAALAATRREEREACARHVEALAIAIRDHGPVSAAGLITGLAGAQVGVLLDAAASLRATRDAP